VLFFTKREKIIIPALVSSENSIIRIHLKAYIVQKTIGNTENHIVEFRIKAGIFAKMKNQSFLMFLIV
jgi:nickel-dependent lactate racemase